MEAVKDDAVNADSENLDNDLDESAKQRPVLQTQVNMIELLDD